MADTVRVRCACCYRVAGRASCGWEGDREVVDFANSAVRVVGALIDAALCPQCGGRVELTQASGAETLATAGEAHSAPDPDPDAGAAASLGHAEPGSSSRLPLAGGSLAAAPSTACAEGGEADDEAHAAAAVPTANKGMPPTGEPHPLDLDEVQRLLDAGTPGRRTLHTEQDRVSGDLLVNVVANEATMSETTVARTDDPAWKEDRQAVADATLIVLLPRLVAALRSAGKAVNAAKECSCGPDGGEFTRHVPTPGGQGRLAWVREWCPAGERR